MTHSFDHLVGAGWTGVGSRQRSRRYVGLIAPPPAARARGETCIGVQRLSFPLAVSTPRSSSARAMPHRLVTPCARRSAMHRSQRLRMLSRRRLAGPTSRLPMLRPELQRALGDRLAVLAEHACLAPAAEPDALRLRRRERRLGPVRDHLALGLRDNGHDAQRSARSPPACRRQTKLGLRLFSSPRGSARCGRADRASRSPASRR